MKGAVDTYDPTKSTIRSGQRNKIAEINDNDVDYKKDYQVGEGATYTGQMKLIIDAKT